jgi:putative heme-binding domain-containing protein
VGAQALSGEQRGLLIKQLPDLGPMELNRVLEGLAQPAGDVIDAAVIDAVRSAGAFRSIPADRLRKVFGEYPESLQPRIGELVATLDEDYVEKQRRIDTLLAGLKDGDVVRGQAIFNSPKAVCSSCHAIGYLGGDVGPDLTRIGQIRSERDLLEAIVYPSASFVRSYESVRVLTKDGDDHNGVLREDAADHLTLMTGPGARVRVARSDIEELLPGSISIMPAGMDEQLSRTELADLLAFLKATRW